MDIVRYFRQHLAAVVMLALGCLCSVSGQTITTISPPIVPAGNPFTLVVDGSGFVSSTTVYWWNAYIPSDNTQPVTFYGSATPLVTTFVSTTELNASVPASLVAGSAHDAGIITLTSANPQTPYFSVQIVLPVVTAVTPTPVYAGINTNLTVSGSAFGPSSTVFVSWQGANGSLEPALSTKYLNANQLTATYPASFIEGPGTFVIIVANCVDTSPPNYVFPDCYDTQSSISLTVVPPPSVVEPSTGSPFFFLPDARAGTQYSFSFSGLNGKPPYTWASQAPLPQGLSLSSSGLLSGVPATSQTTLVDVTLTDANGLSATGGAGLAIGPIQIYSFAPSSGSVSTAYSGVLSAAGGHFPVSWSLATGQLPPGLVLLSPASTSFTGEGQAVLSGTPTVSGTYPVVIRVSDASGASATQSLTITINSALVVTSSTLPNGTVSVAYTATVTAQGGSSPYTWTLASGSLPTGLSLNASTGTIAGTPSGPPGISTFVVQVTDSETPTQTATKQFTANIAPPLTITTTTAPNGTTKIGYSLTLIAQNATAPYTWSLSSGALPTGLGLDSSTGAITGTPTTAGTFSFSVSVTDSGSPSQTAKQAFNNVVIRDGLTITTAALPSGTVGLAYTDTLLTQGGTAPYAWSISKGSLPAGLSLDAPSGTISGLPTVTGAFPFTVQLTDSSKPTAQITTQDLSLFINPPISQPVLPTFYLSGIPASLPIPANISTASVQVSQPSSVAYSGAVALAFSPNVAGLPSGYLGDSGFVDSSGTKTPQSTVLIPAAANGVSLLTLDPGTVAGDVTVTFSLGGQVAAASTVTIEPSVPIIEANSVAITSITANGFEVELVATSTPRDLKTATFAFTPAAGSSLVGNATFTVDVSSLLSQWFASADGLKYGGAFSLSIPFTVTGAVTALQAVEVTLTNSVGTSSPVSGSK